MTAWNGLSSTRLQVGQRLLTRPPANGSSYRVRPGDTLYLILYWHVASGEVAAPYPSQAAPLAAFVHLSATADPTQIVAQFDGWPAALTGLEPGDVVIQPVVLQVSPAAPEGDYVVRVGLYSPQSGLRLPLVSPDGVGDSLNLAPLVVAAPDT